MTPTADPTISVIVPVRNAERYLGGLLESLVIQDVAEPWEVVVVDNRSSDRSMSVVDQFRLRLRIRAVDAPERLNPSYARNVGVRCSAGRKLMFVDADDEVSTGYVAAMAHALETSQLVTSRVDSVTLNPEWVRGAHGPAWQAERIGEFFDFLPAAGINIGVHRHLYLSLGGFSEDFAPSEDIAFCWNARLDAGVDLHFVPDAVYRYRYRDTLRDLFWQTVGWGRASVLLYRRFRQAGMPARSIRHSCVEWQDVIRGLRHASGPPARAELAVRLGHCVGRLSGSLRHRVLFL